MTIKMTKDKWLYEFEMMGITFLNVKRTDINSTGPKQKQ
jgi:hypothetical protein